jgi:hypothetical protein
MKQQVEQVENKVVDGRFKSNRMNTPVKSKGSK